MSNSWGKIARRHNAPSVRHFMAIYRHIKLWSSLALRSPNPEIRETYYRSLRICRGGFLYLMICSTPNFKQRASANAAGSLLLLPCTYQWVLRPGTCVMSRSTLVSNCVDCKCLVPPHSPCPFSTSTVSLYVAKHIQLQQLAAGLDPTSNFSLWTNCKVSTFSRSASFYF